MKVPNKLRRIVALVAAALIALGAFALISSQATAEDVPSSTEHEWG